MMNFPSAAAGNPFLINPFLQMAAAAAAAAASAQNPSSINQQQQQQALMSNMAFLSANFGLSANNNNNNNSKQNPYGNELWPWFNSMAAMTSLYGIENNSKLNFFFNSVHAHFAHE